MRESGRSKGVRDVKKRAATTTGLSKGAAAREVENIEIDHVSPEHHQELVQMDEVVVEQAEGELFSAKLDYKRLGSISAGPSRPPTPASMPPPAVPLSTSRPTVVTRASVLEMMEERDRQWAAKLQVLEQAFAQRIKDLEDRLEEKIRLLAGTTLAASSTSSSVPAFTLTADTPTTLLGKRPEREADRYDRDLTQTPGAGPSRASSSPAAKRQRVEHTEEDDSDVLSPHTPSPPAFAPRTPSPGHQGLRTDNSRTPGIGSDFPPHFSHGKGPNDTNDDDEPVTGLPFPLFPTTPRPSVPLSPTLGAPPTANRHRFPHPRGASLTPGSGRRKPSPAPRAVSDAHKELTTITESDELPLSVQLASRRRVASEATPTRLLANTLRGSSVPSSPPRLSPSPSIGASERDGGFTYTPFPPVPRSALRNGVKPSSNLTRTVITNSNLKTTPRRENDLGDDSDVEELELTPKNGGTGQEQPQVLKRSVSPARDYMDVAMYGLLGPTESPSSTQTPGHRTLLGTERYRDTRFGDVPVVDWGSPSVDLGSGTPASYPKRGW